MGKMKNKNGISLIVLVITILVMIILAGVVIVTMSENNPINKAKEAQFKENLTQIGTELQLFCANELAVNPSFNKESLHANKGKCEFNTNDGSKKNIFGILPSLKGSKYQNQVEIVQGNLFYKTPEKKEIPWLKDMGVYYTGIVTGTVIIEGDTLVGVSPDYVNTGTLVVPSNVKKINPGAFAGCTELAGVILPEGITEIPEQCFINCKGLRSVSIPSTVTKIGRKAFAYCDNLNNIILPQSLVTIGPVAFEECGSLTDVVFNSGLETIEYQAFRRTPIAKLELKDGLKVIASQAFDSTKVVDVKLPESVVLIGKQAFAWCYDLKTIYFGENAVLGENVIRNSPVTNLTISNGNPNYTVIDNVVYNKGVTEVMFAANTVTNVNIPNTVTKIKENAFNDCSKLETLYIPESVNTVGSGILMGCPSLTNLQVSPNSDYYTVDNNVLLNKKGDLLIAAADVNTTYNVPSTIKKIAKGAFQNCKKLTSIVLNEGLDTIGSVAISNTGIKSLEIPSTVRIFEQECFSNNYYLKTVVIKDSETVNKTFYMAPFVGCSELTKINIPKSVTSIHGGFFAKTVKLTDVDFDKRNPNYMYENGVIYSIDGKTAIAALTSTNKLVLRNSVEVIQNNAFINNMYTEVNLPSNVKLIRTYAFCVSNNLKKITIPASCTTIEQYAFENTRLLSEIIINKKAESIQGAPWGATQGTKAVTWVL